jgi:anti-sigma factor RsiW
MKVTRDVIYDLLPGYFAGELSADAKALVEEFFATDPEFARMAERFRKLFNEKRATGSDMLAAQEKQVFERARSLRTSRDRLFGVAAGCTLGLLLALFLGALIPRTIPAPSFFGFMRAPAALASTALAAAAIVAWIGWLLSLTRRFD